MKSKGRKASAQHCWVRKMRNILEEVPDNAYDEVLEQLPLIYLADSYMEAQIQRREFLRRPLYPRAVQSLEEANEAHFTNSGFPRNHWIHLKTTNPIESMFGTVRIRTQGARRMKSRMRALCLVFQVLKIIEHRLRRTRAYDLVPDIFDQVRAQRSKRRKSAWKHGSHSY